CVNRTQSVRDGDEPIGEGHHHFGVAAVEMGSRYWLICAINKISATARLALSAVSAKKPYADALADFPTGNSLAYGVNLSDNLMAGNARKGNAGQKAVYGGGVRVANSAGFDT